MRNLYGVYSIGSSTERWSTVELCITVPKWGSNNRMLLAVLSHGQDHIPHLSGLLWNPGYRYRRYLSKIGIQANLYITNFFPEPE